MTAFGKKSAQPAASLPPASGARANFGKKPGAPAQGRFSAASAAPAGADAELSAKAMAFLEAERARNAVALGLSPVVDRGGAKPAPRSTAQPSYAHAAGSTPGHTPGKPVWGRRIIALLVDSLIVGLPVTLFFGMGIMGAAASSTSETAALMAFLMFAAILGVASILYSVSMEASKKQATWGKMLVGAIVTDVNGGKPSLGAVVMRNTVGRFCSNVIPFYIGYFIGMARQDRRCIHDLISGTMVVAKSKAGLSQADAFA